MSEDRKTLLDKKPTKVMFRPSEVSLEDALNLLNTEGEYSFIESPTFVGGYRFGGPTGVRFNLKEKPCWFHRKMVKLILGWKWVNHE